MTKVELEAKLDEIYDEIQDHEDAITELSRDALDLERELGMTETA